MLVYSLCSREITGWNVFEMTYFVLGRFQVGFETISK